MDDDVRRQAAETRWRNRDRTVEPETLQDTYNSYIAGRPAPDDPLGPRPQPTGSPISPQRSLHETYERFDASSRLADLGDAVTQSRLFEGRPNAEAAAQAALFAARANAYRQAKAAEREAGKYADGPVGKPTEREEKRAAKQEREVWGEPEPPRAPRRRR